MELQDATLLELASAPNYQRWLSDLAWPYLGEHPLEVGAGLGDYADAWLRRGLPEITMTESDEHRRRHLVSRFAENSRAHVADIDLLAPPEAQFSSMVSFNVLEHIEFDTKALA